MNVVRCSPIRLAVAVVASGVWASPAFAQTDATAVFSRYAAAVAKVEVVESRSSAPQSVGTAFFVEPSLLVSNFHVVRGAIYEPTQFTLRVILSDGRGTIEGARILAVDPAHDLAVLEIDFESESVVALTTDSVAVGEALFSLGHPADLNTSVVEGIYNGDVEHIVSPRYHFTGSINPGMSGGPTLTRDGRVVGVNVSTAGNQLSFLIPSKAVASLLSEAEARPANSRDELIEQIGDRLSAFQAGFYDRFLGEPLPTTTIGSWRVPSGPEEFFDCSASPHDTEDQPYEVVEYSCYTEDMVLLGPDRSYDLLYLETMYMSSEELGAWRFNSLVNNWFQSVLGWETPQTEAATDYRCRRDNLAVDGSGHAIRVVFCARRHARHPGLFDAFIRTAAIEGRREAAVGTYSAVAISFENATRLVERLVEAHAWVAP